MPLGDLEPGEFCEVTTDANAKAVTGCTGPGDF